jgi:hypothetical protein
LPLHKFEDEVAGGWLAGREAREEQQRDDVDGD